ncbi:restriction endonuclease subunit S [Citrobacter freundii]|uniref:restriction endonuclease subunit S n=1 Tax=Citrobacter portucalensis TaxID=1639133 RepID=UPI0015E9ED9E|nr:restriction endonuclease subunit S [Citrobacter portucalensis]MCX8972552.1 restriction endonuclease subunit S [Citrobacter portucalensis]QMF94012.1 restriction endonuclease subunit S [Citrobacter freundii]
MSSNWPLKKISEIANFLNNKRIPLKSLDRQKRQGSYPYYGASGIVDSIDGYIFDGTYLLISEDGENLRTRKTPIAFKAHGKFWVNNHAHILSEQEEGVLDYLEYYFSTLDLNPYITGAAQPKLNKANLDSINIPFPDRSVRLFINSTLNSLTQKIATNNQINQTLEQMAQALFKSWFVDFEPVKAKMSVLEAGGSQEDATLAAMAAISGKDADALAVFEREHPEQYAELKATAELFPSAMQDSELGAIPEGWRVKPLGDSLEIKRGGSPRPIKDFIRPTGYPWVKIADATASISPFLFKTSEFIKEEGLKKTVYLRKGDLILSNSATPGLPKFLQLDACIHDGWLYFPKITNYTDTYLYFLFLKIRPELVAKGNGSVFTNLKTDILREHLAVLPECKIVNRFSILALSYLDAIKANELTINSLSCLRDTLLPKLLSGEITLPEAEQAVSEAENV